MFCLRFKLVVLFSCLQITFYQRASFFCCDIVLFLRAVVSGRPYGCCGWWVGPSLYWTCLFFSSHGCLISLGFNRMSGDALGVLVPFFISIFYFFYLCFLWWFVLHWPFCGLDQTGWRLISLGCPQSCLQVTGVYTVVPRHTNVPPHKLNVCAYLHIREPFETCLRQCKSQVKLVYIFFCAVFAFCSRFSENGTNGPKNVLKDVRKKREQSQFQFRFLKAASDKRNHKVSEGHLFSCF